MTLLDQLEALERAATPWESLTITRYAHGGGRIYLDGEAGERELVADFYREVHREQYIAVRNALPALLAVCRAANTYVETGRLRGDLVDAVHALRAIDDAGGAK